MKLSYFIIVYKCFGARNIKKSIGSRHVEVENRLPEEFTDEDTFVKLQQLSEIDKIMEKWFLQAMNRNKIDITVNNIPSKLFFYLDLVDINNTICLKLSSNLLKRTFFMDYKNDLSEYLHHIVMKKIIKKNLKDWFRGFSKFDIITKTLDNNVWNKNFMMLYKKVIFHKEPSFSKKSNRNQLFPKKNSSITNINIYDILFLIFLYSEEFKIFIELLKGEEDELYNFFNLQYEILYKTKEDANLFSLNEDSLKNYFYTCFSKDKFYKSIRDRTLRYFMNENDFSVAEKILLRFEKFLNFNRRHSKVAQNLLGLKHDVIIKKCKENCFKAFKRFKSNFYLF